MKPVAARLLVLSAVLFSIVISGAAQQTPTVPATRDPRVGLKAGLRDAGQAARNMELIAALPKPEGFFDPKAPGGTPTPPERPESEASRAGTEPEPPPNQQEDPARARLVAGLNFANSDLAFSANHLFMGNFNGFNTYDIERPGRPKLLASVVCPGGQGDVSVHGNLLFMSVEQTRGRIDCGTQGVPATVSTERFRGIRIFDITDVNKPKQVAAIQTCRGSHTHTLVTDLKDPANLYVYGSGTSTVRSGDELPGCSGRDPKEDPNTALFSIDVIQ